MLILANTTDILEVVLGGAITTNQARCVSSWRDITVTGFAPDRTVILTNSATPVNAVGSPAASTQRVIDLLNVFNSDTVAATVTVQYNANGTRYTLWSASLATGESLQYTDGNGWEHLNASGNKVLSSGINTINGTTAEITASTAAGVTTLSLPTALTFTGKTITGGTFASPTFTTPALGTPTSGTLTNCTIPASALTGTTLAASVVTSSLTTVGALASGSLANGFGNISIGSSSISGGAISGSGLTIDNNSTDLVGVFDGTVGAYSKWQVAGTAVGDVGSGNSLVSGGSASDFGINVRGANNLIVGVNGAKVATFTSTGLNSTAIGATTPSTVAATTISAATASSNALTINRSSGGSADIRFQRAGVDKGYIADNADGVTIYDAAAAARLAVTSAGAAVTGTLAATGSIVTNGYDGNTGSGTSDGTYDDAAGTYIASKNGGLAMALRRRSSDGVIAEFRRDTTQVGTISVTTTATAYNTSSDIRLKTNVRDIPDSGAIIDALKPSLFDWKTGEKDSYGFIAQEVYPIFPQAVSKGDDDPETITQQWAMDAGKMMPVVIAELKSLRKRVAELEGK